MTHDPAKARMNELIEIANQHDAKGDEHSAREARRELLRIALSRVGRRHYPEERERMPTEQLEMDL